MRYRNLSIVLALLCVFSSLSLANETEQIWKQEAKPRLNFFELDGYMRVRADAFNRLDLGTYIPDGANAGGTSSVLPPLQYFDQNYYNSATAGSARAGWLFSSNMRLRLDPTLNVSEDIRVRMTLDLLDNLVLGSTPNYMTGLAFANPSYPYSFLSTTQNAPLIGINNAWGPINLKRVWGEVTTPVGEWRFGRMPMNFGLGLLYNAGNLETNDYGDNVDGVMFATRVFGHYVIPGISMSYTGATGRAGGFGNSHLQFLGAELGQRYDLDPSDNVYSFFLTIAKKDKEIDTKILLTEGKTVVNYGVLGSYRFQIYDSQYTQFDPNKNSPSDLQKQLQRRDAQVGYLSLWGDVRWDRLHVEAEAVGILGHIGNSQGLWADKNTKEPLWLMQAGVALKSRYGFLNDRLEIGLDAGWASGDSHKDTSSRPGAQNPITHSTITNFRFNPDYRVDMILFREVIGTVTNAFYLKPHIGYNFSSAFGIRADAISSFANFAASTPGNSQMLGLELDASLFYRSDDGFNISLQYGFLVPFAGLGRPSGEPTPQLWTQYGSPSSASALRLFAGIVF